MPSIARDANLLGALSLAVTGRMLEGGPATERLGPSGAPAVLALASWLDGGSIEQLRAVLDLTHSGAVRLVDRLEAGGFVERRGGPDGRTVALGVTAEGAQAALQVQRERGAALEELLSALGSRQRREFERSLELLLASLVERGPAPPGRICRMCDARACGHYDGRCPVTEAARAGAR